MQIPTNPHYSIDLSSVVRLISTNEIVPEYINRHGRRAVKIRGKSHKPSSHPLDRLMLNTYKPLSVGKDPEWFSVKYHNGNRDDISIENLDWDDTWYHPPLIPGVNIPADNWVKVYGQPYMELQITPDSVRFRNSVNWQELIPSVSTTGYLEVKPPNKQTKLWVHRLVALTLLSHPLDTDHLTVNHKDSYTMNNRLENLEWTTASQNNTHAYHEGPRGNTIRKIVALNVIDKSEHVLSGYNDLARYLGVKPGSAHSAMERRAYEGKPYKKHLLKYVDDPRSWDEIRNSTKRIEKRKKIEKVACRNMDTGGVKIYDNLAELEEVEGINLHSLYRLLSGKQMAPFKRRCIQEVVDDKELKWPNYPSDILDVYERVHASDKPIRVTDKYGNAKLYPSVTAWCMEDRENRLDPAVLSRYMKYKNQWRDWVFEYIDLGKYLHKQHNS